MYKLFATIALSFSLLAVSNAQVVVLWKELNKTWSINSEGYPSEEQALDSLYYKIADFSLTLNADSSYKMTYTKDSIVTGSYSINKRKREITFNPKKSARQLTYSVAELTPSVLVLTISYLYSWVYYLSLTSHQ